MTTPATPESTDATKGKKGKGKILIMAVAVVVLLGGGGAAYWMYAKGGEPKEGTKKAKEEVKEPEGPGAAIPMDPFVVNLADPGHFLRVSLSLVVADEEQAKVFEESPVTKMKARSAILELLALQTAEQLVTPEGKAELKKAIAEAASKAVSETHISNVLFSEFVVQF